MHGTWGGKRRLTGALVAVLTIGAGSVGIGAVGAYAANPGQPVVASSGSGLTVAHTSSPTSPTSPRGVIPHVTRGHATPKSALGKASANPACPSCNPPLLFTQGNGFPVIGGLTGTAGHVTIVPVYWAPGGYTYTTNYKSVVNGYITNVAAASGATDNVFSMGTEYYQEATAGGAPLKHIHYSAGAGVEIDDTTAFPAQGGVAGCTADAGFTDCVTDPALQAELNTKLTALSKPKDDQHLYMVFFPSGVETCFGTGPASMTNPCNTNVYCAYHSTTAVSSTAIVYANEPFPILNQCSDPWDGPQAPSGDSYADAQISLVSHEANETITDWAGAWFDSAGFENGDQCAYVYGSALGSTGVATDGFASGTGYNQVVGTGKYYIQDEFSNQLFGLGVGDPPAPAVAFIYGNIAGCQQRPVLPGFLRVTTSPAVPAQITLVPPLTSGVVADTWGLNWLKFPPGSLGVCFSSVQGYTTPICQTVSVSSGVTTTVTGTFVQRGFLKVQTSPAVPSTISVDGNRMDDWGVYTDIPIGSHQVCFGLVPNFTPPICQTAMVTAGATTTITGTFTSSPGASGQTGVGLLRVTTSPALPSQITVDGNIADTWGLNWLEIAPGSHTVCFSSIQGYTTPLPGCQTVTVTAGITTPVTGTFVQRGFLKVQTSPASAGTISVNGIPSDDWGVFTDMPPGTYQVCFGIAGSFVNTPACQSAVVTAGSTTTITGTYS